MKFLLEIAIIAASAVLCSVLHGRQFNKTYPHFYRYAFFQMSASAGSLLAYTSMDVTSYAVTYYVLTFLGDILAVFVAAEIGGKLLGPQGALPQWVNDRLTLVMGLGIATTLAVAIFLLRSSYGRKWGQAAVTVEHWAAGIIWVAFSVVLIFWATLKVFRRQIIAASICSGFVLYFTVSIFTVFIRGHKAFAGIADLAGSAGMVAYLVAILWWAGAVLLPVPTFTKATYEQQIFMLQEFEAVQKAVARTVIMPR